MLRIGDKLKYIRESKEITQKEVSLKTGINSKTLSGYENNVSYPDLDTFRLLMLFYGISADTVLDISPSKQNGENEYCDDEKKLIEAYRKLSEIKKAEIRGEIKGILSSSQEEQSAVKESDDVSKRAI